MSLNEIIFNLHNIVRGGILSDDDNISELQLMFMVNYVRSIVIKRDQDKGKSIDQQIIQDLECVPVQAIDKAECCEITADCLILRTVNKIPKPIDLNQKSGLTFVGDVDGGEQYMASTYSTVVWSQFSNYTAKLPRYFEKSGYIYVVNRDLSDFIRIRGLFEDPREAAKFNTCDGKPCYNDDMEYPISSWMLPVINDMLLKGELKIESQTQDDETNEARDNAGEKVR